jgi:hypothetical protein
VTARETWVALSARIRGLQDASQLAARLLSSNNDSVGVIIDLGNHASAILSDLIAFKGSLGREDRFTIEAIERVASKVEPFLVDKNSSTEIRQILIRSALVMIIALEGEVSYLLRDREEALRHRSERAFIHLNRSIMADSRVRGSWELAYKDGEVACEKLGAVHLLAHGIWAFKVDGVAGGRTDLVFQDTLTDMTDVHRSGDGLVLTEWKKHSGRQDPGKLFNDARQQAMRYSAGVLAGAELTRYRYAIVVSENHVNIPDDVEVKGCVFRHINVVVSPKTPSKQR